MINDFRGYLKVRLVKPQIASASFCDPESDPQVQTFFSQWLFIVDSIAEIQYIVFRISINAVSRWVGTIVPRWCYILIVQMHLVCSPGPLILIKNAISSS